MELVGEMEEKASRLTREATGGSEGEVGGNQQVREVVRVDLAGDGGVVAGRAGIPEYSTVVGGEPEKTEDGGVQVGMCGAQVMEG